MKISDGIWFQNVSSCYLHKRGSGQNISFTVITQEPIGVFGISIIIGLLFVIYPARKAAQLNSIDALRYE